MVSASDTSLLLTYLFDGFMFHGRYFKHRPESMKQCWEKIKLETPGENLHHSKIVWSPRTPKLLVMNTSQCRGWTRAPAACSQLTLKHSQVTPRGHICTF